MFNSSYRAGPWWTSRASETEGLAMRMTEYTRIMLVRARAAARLMQRGHDVSTLLAADEP
ncbi:MAG TPA: hypothetical protein VE093_29190 [Polyangiaceae bacterium]|nr:hypothetical protein [Polyangiaceae bacterium]